MSSARYFKQNVVPLLPSSIKVTEISDGCFRVKNVITGKCIHYYSKADRIFVNFTGEWKNNIQGIFVKSRIFDILVDGTNKI